VSAVTTDWKGEAARKDAEDAKAAAKPQRFSLVIRGTRGDGDGEPLPEHRLNVVIQNTTKLRSTARGRVAAAVEEAGAMTEDVPDEDLMVEPVASPRRWSLP
jgi:hypothetical protein